MPPTRADAKRSRSPALTHTVLVPPHQLLLIIHNKLPRMSLSLLRRRQSSWQRPTTRARSAASSSCAGLLQRAEIGVGVQIGYGEELLLLRLLLLGVLLLLLIRCRRVGLRLRSE